MTYKKSRFNVEIDKLQDGRILLYNTYSGIFGIMDVKTQGMFFNVENIDITCINDEELRKNIDIMLQSGYIIDIEKDELATLKIERDKFRHPQNSMNLTIAPTLQCNMCCPYCFEDKKDIVMSSDIQDKLFNFVETHFAAYPTIKKLSVQWYGGEPLMEKDVIYNLSEKFIKFCEEKGATYSASMITNGALLDGETAKRLSEDCKVNYVQITMDGMKENHNKRRILVSGEDSFEIIMKNIEESKDYLSISVRVNVDKTNNEDIMVLTKYFLEEKGWTDNPIIYLAPVEEFTENCLVGESSCLDGEQFAEIDIECVRAIHAVNRNSIAHKFFPRRKSVFCSGEGMNHYVVDPEGYTYTCYVNIGEEKNRLGHIDKPFVINTEYGKWLTTDIPKDCEPCEYLPMCMGGCGFHRINGDGSPKCFKTFYTYKDILKLAHEDYVAQKK